MAQEMLRTEQDIISMPTCILQKSKVKEEIEALSTRSLWNIVQTKI